MNKEMKNLIQSRFLAFFAYMNPDFKVAKHQKYISNMIQNEVLEKKEGRLLLSVPPGHAKSYMCSQMLPAYILGVNPKARILILTYGADLSNSHGKKVREFINKPEYKEIFPDTVVVGDGMSGSFETTAGGSVRCVGRGGGITGFRADMIIADDTIKNQQEAQSPRVINGLWEWFTTTAYTRLVPGGKLLAFNTRWCVGDLIGRCIENYPDWGFINLPAIAEENDPMYRDVGEALWPELYTLDKLNEVREAAPKTFGALYQGNPVDREATPIKLDSIVQSYGTDVSIDNKSIVTSWDTASTTTGDYTVCSVWLINKEYSKLIAIKRQKVELPGLLKMFDEVNSLYNPAINIVENANSGIQLLQLRDNCLKSSTIRQEHKYSLAETFNFFLNSGKISVIEGCLDNSMITELVGFPYERHDDIALSILHFVKNWIDESVGLHLYKQSNSLVRELQNKVIKLTKRAKKSARRLKNRFTY